jgi:ribonuclease D
LGNDNYEIQDIPDLTPEYINKLPVLAFNGRIHLISTAEEMSKALVKLKKELCVGFDTESRPSFIKGQNFPISLIQLATPTDAFIIRFRSVTFCDSLVNFLESSTEKIGLGIKDDIRKLKSERMFTPNTMIDLSEIAKMKGHQKSSLRMLSAYYLRKRIVKSAQKTNWARSKLTDAQLRYAATDAWACLLLRPLLEKAPHMAFDAKL